MLVSLSLRVRLESRLEPLSPEDGSPSSGHAFRVEWGCRLGWYSSPQVTGALTFTAYRVVFARIGPAPQSN